MSTIYRAVRRRLFSHTHCYSVHLNKLHTCIVPSHLTVITMSTPVIHYFNLGSLGRGEIVR